METPSTCVVTFRRSRFKSDYKSNRNGGVGSASDFWKRLRSFGKGFLADVRVTVAHGGALVAH